MGLRDTMRSEWIHPDRLKFYSNGKKKPTYIPKESVDETALAYIKEKIRK
jgi:hypothetical protein